MAEALALDSSSVVLLTGGARGITALAALRLAERRQPKLILVGRSPLPAAEEASDTAGIVEPKELKAALINRMRLLGETVKPATVEHAYSRLLAEREIRDTLARLRHFGSEAHYFAVDVRDMDAFAAFIDDIYDRFGRLDAVIHGAGVIEDKLIEDKTVDSFDRVFDTKVNSAFVLSQRLRPDSLKFLAFFSSVSGRFGNRGQADYAAANEVLNKIAADLSGAWPCRTVAINWGPWETNGMASPEVRRQFAERGIEIITPAVGVARLEEELKCSRMDQAEVVIGGAKGLASSSKSPAASESPLLLRAESTLLDGVLEFVCELDPGYDRYLDHHRLDGKPVVPLAVATELIAEAAASGWPKRQVVALRDLRPLHGIVLDAGAKTIRVRVDAAIRGLLQSKLAFGRDHRRERTQTHSLPRDGGSGRTPWPGSGG